MDLPEPYEPTDDELAHGHAKAGELAEVAMRLGLHQQGYRLGVGTQVNGAPALVVIADFLPGDLAFSDATLNPEKNDVDVEFRAIERDLKRDDFEAYRRELAREHGVELDGDV